MDTVTVNGKTYVKASRAADTAGYTADYVGQLCRGGKIDAVLLGKTWYVLDGVLLAHKQAKTRANTETTRRDFKRQRELLAQRAPQVAPLAEQRILDSAIRYIHDDAALMPPVRRVESAVAEAEPYIDPVPQELVMPAVAQEVSEGADTTNEASEAEYEPEISADIDSEPVVGAYDAGVIPVRRIRTPAPSARRKLLERQLMTHAGEDVVSRRAQSEAAVDIQRVQSVTKPPSRAVAKVSERALAPRRSMLPMLATALLALFVLANLLVERTGNYVNDGADTARYSSGYGVASVVSILDELKNAK